MTLTKYAAVLREHTNGMPIQTMAAKAGLPYGRVLKQSNGQNAWTAEVAFGLARTFNLPFGQAARLCGWIDREAEKRLTPSLSIRDITTREVFDEASRRMKEFEDLYP